MLKKQATRLTEKDCIIDIRNQVLMQTVMLKVDIEILSAMPEDFVVGDKNVSQVIGGIQGKVAIKAKEAIETKQKQLSMLNKKIDAIDKLLNVV